MREYLTGVQHVGIPTDDLQATCAFYQKLGFEPAFETIHDGAGVTFLRLGDLTMEVYESPETAKKAGAVDHVAINVTDIDAVYREVCALGLNTQQETIHTLPFWANGVRFFTIQGPNQESIEFSQIL